MLDDENMEKNSISHPDAPTGFHTQGSAATSCQEEVSPHTVHSTPALFTVWTAVPTPRVHQGHKG